jgi:tRNA(Phe) wybutosine-synthesizing methylase Tyw3
MDVDNTWKKDLLAELDKTINRGNVDRETLELMKELLKGAKARVSISEYFNEQD